MSRKSHTIIGASCGLGYPACQDSREAPSYLRRLGLLERVRALDPGATDFGDVNEPPLKKDSGDERCQYADEIYQFNQELYRQTTAILESGRRPIVVGGDHSISIGSVSAASNWLKKNSGAKSKLGLLWVDAHGDINTPSTTPSGTMHGMPLAFLLGLGDPRFAELGGNTPKILPENIVYIGLRDLDPPERSLIKKLGITAFTMKEVDLLGIGEICQQAYAKLKKLPGFAISFDLDVCDPRLAPGVGTPVRGGLTFRESHLVAEMAAECKNLILIELVEFRPSLDVAGSTAELALGLIESAMGKSIL